MTADTADRQAFDKWFQRGCYGSHNESMAWIAWLDAIDYARAALPARAPEGWVTVGAAPKGFKLAYVPDYPEDRVVGPCICGSWPGGKCLRCPVENDPNPPAMLSTAPPHPEQSGENAEAHHGWLYTCPDTGIEWSEQHPIESGEVPDAQDVRPATVDTLLSELLAAWSSPTEPLASPAPGPAEPRGCPTPGACSCPPPGPTEPVVRALEDGEGPPTSLVVKRAREMADGIDKYGKCGDLTAPYAAILLREMARRLEAPPPASDERVAAIREMLELREKQNNNLRARLDAMYSHASQIAHLAKGGALPLDGEG